MAYAPAIEHAVWYQHLFQSAAEIAWRPIGANFAACFGVNGRLNWYFGDATFERTAVSFDNPDFVDVVLHHYRHAFGLAAGDPSLAHLEERLARRPRITVPSVTLDGISDTLKLLNTI